ncbi:PREDICTED: cysteine-rich receptor-like protein kinase 11 isoform X1 [Camelina sativa]|uniref:Cysteine-rich receptor-like protein kinase 11 isoform X1 n=3 Tax=Camelina sativa TaxID=90675 RepID=A0ABM1QI77_CAMSA|nr:PREDICTED: cysteine-rich receptor-like protein kinase 11 isoform X1 [Camelina sativa]
MKQSILCFFLIVNFNISSVPAQTCMNSGNFTPNSTYDKNRGLILSSLPSNVTAQVGFFYNGSIGQEQNQVYAIGMCIPGSAPDDCSNCIKKASDGLIQRCPNQTEAYSWHGEPTLCHVRYSNTSFSGSADMEPSLLVSNTEDVNSNLSQLSEIYNGVIFRMINAASTAKSTLSSSNNFYNAPISAVSASENIYALMQCTPDLSSDDCESCLQESTNDYQLCCSQKQGGTVMRPSCFFRWDLKAFSNAFGDIMVAPSPPLQQPGKGDTAHSADTGKISTGALVAIVVSIVVVVLMVIIFLVLRAQRSFVYFSRRKTNQQFGFDQSGITVHSLQIDFNIIAAATNNFARSNKLGQGGFGEVYKGTLPNGTEVAVKRLSKESAQGALEFKNEVVVVAKLQHRNLVRLLGFCLEGEEKILVYEFVPNRSLDYFLFDPRKQGQLDWTKRYNIIRGIARGVLYLHQDSRVTIIHRDLKASNILLDADMNPKIADFGMARIFGMDQSGANTKRIVGTRGYISPEYVTRGVFSTKSDVFSFGVLVLEIICGRHNIFSNESDTTAENLVTYVWRLWRNGSPLEIVDPNISENIQTNEVARCIHIALLCVQKEPKDRPKLSTIMLMLTSNTHLLPTPNPPGFLFPNGSNQERVLESIEMRQSMIGSNSHTVNNVTVSDLDPR